ncbi:hypothetical protein CSIRO_1740 [Bradyrhizobiaceae bacterium SG-6C]|nr:hypothetical protein CSIRO_1740 [Bradyrhizobiaceae bacterium SG-6C]
MRIPAQRRERPGIATIMVSSYGMIPEKWEPVSRSHQA